MGTPQADRLADVGLLLTSHPGHWRWNESCFVSLSGFPGFVWFGCDDDVLPNVESLKANHNGRLFTYCTGKHWPSIGDIRGDMSLMKEGAACLLDAGAKWIFKMSADTCLWRWRNLMIVEDYRQHHRSDVSRRGTSYIFAPSSVFVKVVNCYDINHTVGSCELFWNNTERSLGIQKSGEGTRWWEATLGAVHMHGEWALNNLTSIDDARNHRDGTDTV